MNDDLLAKIRNVSNLNNEEKIELIKILKEENTNNTSSPLYEAIETFENFCENSRTIPFILSNVIVKTEIYQSLLKNLYNSMQTSIRENAEIIIILEQLDKLSKKHVFFAYSVINISKIQELIDKIYAIIPTIK